MGISADYLDIDSDQMSELTAPLKDLLKDREVAIKTLEVFLSVQGQKEGKVEEVPFWTNEFHPIIPPPSLTDRQLYDEMQAVIHAPPENEGEAALTSEKLLERRDPEGISKLPFESPKIQEVLAKARQYITTQWEKGEFHKVDSCYRRIIRSVHRDLSGDLRLSHLEIKVGYIYRSRPTEMLYQTLSPQSSMTTVGAGA